MADFRIWGTIEHVGPQEFCVIATSTPDPPHSALLSESDRETFESLNLANAGRDRMILQMAARVRARGDRVVDVEEG